MTYPTHEIPIRWGPGGGIRQALDQLNDDRFLVMNGDSYCPFDLSDMFNFHTSNAAVATILTARVDDCSPYGSVDASEDGRVLAFREKSKEERAGFVNAGAYVLERAAVESIPTRKPFSIEKDFSPSLVNRGLYTVRTDNPFIDIGTPESYQAAEAFFTQQVSVRPRS